MGTNLILLFLTLTFVGVGLDSVAYPGFFAKYLLIDSRVLVFVCLMLLATLSFLKKSKLSKLAHQLLFLNNRFALPILMGSTVGLTVVEYMHYPNYVFTTLHIQYGHLAFALLLSSALYLFSQKALGKISSKVQSYLWLSIILLYVGLLIQTSQNYIFPTLSLEDGVFEWLEVLFFFGASVITFFGALKSYRKKDALSAFLFAGLTILFFFIAGEEISWGQRIFGIATPDTVKQINEQGETTLHNLQGVQDKRDLFYILFSAYFALGWTTLSLVTKRLKKFISPWYLTLFFIPMLFITLTGQFETVYQEYGEVTLALGVFLYALETQRIE